MSNKQLNTNTNIGTTISHWKSPMYVLTERCIYNCVKQATVEFVTMCEKVASCQELL